MNAVPAEDLRQRPRCHWHSFFQCVGRGAQRPVSHRQVLARNMVVDIDDAKAGPLKIAGNPIKLPAHPDPTSRGAVPELDGDRARILAQFGSG